MRTGYPQRGIFEAHAIIENKTYLKHCSIVVETETNMSSTQSNDKLLTFCAARAQDFPRIIRTHGHAQSNARTANGPSVFTRSLS